MCMVNPHATWSDLIISGIWWWGFRDSQDAAWTQLLPLDLCQLFKVQSHTHWDVAPQSDPGYWYCLESHNQVNPPLSLCISDVAMFVLIHTRFYFCLHLTWWTNNIWLIFDIRNEVRQLTCREGFVVWDRNVLQVLLPKVVTLFCLPG